MIRRAYAEERLRNMVNDLMCEQGFVSQGGASKDDKAVSRVTKDLSFCPLVLCHDESTTQPHLFLPCEILPGKSLPELDPTWACLHSKHLMTVAYVVLHLHKSSTTAFRQKSTNNRSSHRSWPSALKHEMPRYIFLRCLDVRPTYIEIIWMTLVHK